MIRATKTDIAPDTQTTFAIRGIDLDGVEREETLSLSPNAPAETISEHAYSRLLLPEDRTEDEQHTLLHWLEATTQTESRCIGTQPDENGVEREVWQHTFTIDHLPASPKRWGEVDSFFDNPRANCALARMGEQAVKQHKAEERARKRTRRQCRAAQRRHNRGRS